MGELVDFNLIKLQRMIKDSEASGGIRSAAYFKKILEGYTNGLVDIHWINGRIKVEKMVEVPNDAA